MYVTYRSDRIVRSVASKFKSVFINIFFSSPRFNVQFGKICIFDARIRSRAIIGRPLRRRNRLISWICRVPILVGDRVLTRHLTVSKRRRTRRRYRSKPGTSVTITMATRRAINTTSPREPRRSRDRPVTRTPAEPDPGD